MVLLHNLGASCTEPPSESYLSFFPIPNLLVGTPRVYYAPGTLPRWVCNRALDLMVPRSARAPAGVGIPLHAAWGGALPEISLHLLPTISPTTYELKLLIVKARNARGNFQLLIITHDHQFLETLHSLELLEDYFDVSRDARVRFIPQPALHCLILPYTTPQNSYHMTCTGGCVVQGIRLALHKVPWGKSEHNYYLGVLMGEDRGNPLIPVQFCKWFQWTTKLVLVLLVTGVKLGSGGTTDTTACQRRIAFTFELRHVQGASAIFSLCHVIVNATLKGTYQDLMVWRMDVVTSQQSDITYPTVDVLYIRNSTLNHEWIMTENRKFPVELRGRASFVEPGRAATLSMIDGEVHLYGIGTHRFCYWCSRQDLTLINIVSSEFPCSQGSHVSSAMMSRESPPSLRNAAVADSLGTTELRLTTAPRLFG
uniref:Uncharacterized protein n=1 Tax=Timema genevievae TaxID=629358 RepID=A0A7R9K0P1_TIMGE|nr:unnamed protein product [Timema genevievae]